MNEITHHGKIARLPRKLRDELNQRLDNGEPGGNILAWLNALPEVQAVLASGFGGGPINKQNLSNWRQGGYVDWLKQQERRDLVRELTHNASELLSAADGAEIANHLSAMLVAEFAAAARSAQVELTDPAERCARLQECLQTLARVRRQDYLAGKLAIDREQWERERLKQKEEEEDYRKQCQQEFEPMKQAFNRSDMADLYARPDFTSQAIAGAKAEALLRDVKPDAPQPTVPARRPTPGSN